MLIEQQISERRERAKTAIARILARPDGQPFGDYQIRSASGKTYRVALRGSGLFENFCSCPDFAVNTLGTCKHIEALLIKVRRRGPAAERSGFKRSRASLWRASISTPQAFCGRSPMAGSRRSWSACAPWMTTP
jgi:hypothetical protein